ncbi:hypothetical protein diail_311 [Diaporthe ilicicola]|nr:hypothetical protein diail_311 [Diaporthe ilicicola]
MIKELIDPADNSKFLDLRTRPNISDAQIIQLGTLPKGMLATMLAGTRVNSGRKDQEPGLPPVSKLLTRPAYQCLFHHTAHVDLRGEWLRTSALKVVPADEIYTSKLSERHGD